MAKKQYIPTLSTYETSFSDIGDISNYNDVNKTFDVNNITTTSVANVIGAGAIRSVRQLCTFEGINEYALFRPNGVAPYNLGDFGGYNHQAKPPTYFQSPRTSVSGTIGKSGGVYFFPLYFNLRRGERWPLDSMHDYWARVKVKVTYKRTGYPIEIYWSPMEEVKDLTIGTTHSVDLLISNANATGVISVEGWYCNENGSPYLPIEGVHPDIAFSFVQHTIPISITAFSDFSYSGARLYYSNGTIIDYIAYDLATLEVGDFSHLIIKTSGESQLSPLRHPSNGSLFNRNTAYVNYNGLMYRIELTAFTSTVEIGGDTRKLDSTLKAIYKGSNVQTVSGYPTTDAQLMNL